MSAARNTSRLTARLLASLALVASSLPFGDAAAADGDAAAFDPVGTWYVLIHYRDAESAHPERWHWRDEVWSIERDAERLSWTRYPIVQFDDTTRRFENLGTNRARRLVGAWEPNPTQRLELANGVRVGGRGQRAHVLERSTGTTWESVRSPLRAAATALTVDYRETWRIELAGPVFEIRDSIRTGDAEEGGFERLAAASADGSTLTGTYERDGRLHGRFRMQPTKLREPEVLVDGSQRLDMRPDERIRNEMSIVLAALRPLHYFGDRAIEVETTPPGADIDVAYLRHGAQLRYRTARTPARIELPNRFQAAATDVIRVRALLPGYERAEASTSVGSALEKMHFELKPLASRLSEVAHAHLLDQSVLRLRTTEEPVLHVARTPGSVQIVLSRTAVDDAARAAVAAMRDRNVARAEALQVGEDLVLDLRLADGVDGSSLDVRRLSFDAGDDAWTAIELSPHGSASGRVERTRMALDRIGAAALSPCARAFDDALRGELGAAELSLALTPATRIVGPTLRASMRRLIDASPGHAVGMADGAELVATTELELEFALAHAGDVRGYLSLLRTLVDELEPPDLRTSALRGLVAPRVPSDAFVAVFARADAARAACVASRPAPDHST